ncbi:MAG: glutathione peroxidase [Bacteroidia bacterium]
MKGSKMNKMGGVFENKAALAPSQSIYDLEIELNSGQKLSLSTFKNKNLLLVNTASDCGFTGQYKELQELHEQMGETLAIIGFPANDFKGQESGSDEKIAEFCQVNYGVTFPLAKKASVVKGETQQEVFTWLSNEKLNGWCNQEPVWNFSKYLVSENGKLQGFYGPGVSPLSIPLK